MPVTSTIVPCPAGQWTSIAPYLETRRTLIVQCPEQRATINEVNVTLSNVNPSLQLVARNPLRIKLMLCGEPLPAAVTLAYWEPTADTIAGGNFLGVNPANFQTWLVDDYEYASLQWVGQYTFGVAGNHSVSCFETLATCAAVILGIDTSVATVAGPGGTGPIGIWQSPDLSGGGSQFRLDLDRDGELVKQAWFVWPIGSGTVNVNVLQTFDVPPERSALVVQLPSLSPHGKLAAWELLKAMRPKADDDAGLQDDQEF